MLEYLSALTMLAAVALGVFAPQILQIFTRSVYVPAAPYALVLMAFTGPLSFIAQLFFIGLYVRQRTLGISGAYVAAALTNVVLNLWWDPAWGVWGAVWATVAAGVLLAGLAYVASQRVYPVPYRLERLLLLGLLYAGVLAVFLLVPAADHLLARLGAVGVMAGGILGLGIVTPQQLAFSWRALSERSLDALDLMRRRGS